jgi:probable rRNA maturation factor
VKPAAQSSARRHPRAAAGAAHRPRLRLAVQGRDAFDGLPAPTTLRRWIRHALQADAELTLRFVDAREGRRLNRDFRRRDYPTNVLTFDYAAAPVQADIVICVPVAEREARAQRKPRRAHLVHLVVHGVLHAQGYDHEKPADADRMERLETRLLAELGYPDPYTAPRAGVARHPQPARDTADRSTT